MPTVKQTVLDTIATQSKGTSKLNQKKHIARRDQRNFFWGGGGEKKGFFLWRPSTLFLSNEHTVFALEAAAPSRWGDDPGGSTLVCSCPHFMVESSFATSQQCMAHARGSSLQISKEPVVLDLAAQPMNSGTQDDV